MAAGVTVGKGVAREVVEGREVTVGTRTKGIEE